MRRFAIALVLCLAACGHPKCPTGSQPATFEPQPDITTYELAWIFSRTSGYLRGGWTCLGPDVPPWAHRHFVDGWKS